MNPNTQILWNLDHELWNSGNAVLAPQVYTAQATHEEPGGRVVRGSTAIAAAIAYLRTVFPDFALDLTQVVTEGDRFFLCWTCHGSHQGDYMGVPPTGKRAELQGTTVGRLRDGRIDEERVYYDRLSFLEQVGAVAATDAEMAHAEG